ncbi:MAG: hypothetical protein J6U64_04060, partial [Alphaproteobacteria bacterium]|nr:hypothetical protein [Alphaproteobacteria bacterium]
MKQVVLFIIVMLFSVKSHAVCPLPPVLRPRCQIAEGVFKNGEVSYKQSYCKGDFPYCETWSGDCCSEPSYVTDGGGLCCNPSEYVGHKVASINPGGTMLSVSAYKCCSIAEYGKNSTYYFDKEDHVHCCGGKVYQAKSGSDEKSCCNPEFDSEGNITHYHTVVSVKGAPEGEPNQVCCKSICDAPCVYRATAYWNGSSAQCCEGTAYKTGTDNAGKEMYGCCYGTKAPKEERTHGVVSVLGAQNGEEGCCPYYEEEGKKKLGTAYWNGSSVQCCNGIAYQPKGEEVKEYGCCTNGTSPSSIQGVPETEEIKQKCCEEGSTAYWNGSSAQCCSGKPYQSGIDQSGNPTYGCCAGDTAENPTHKVAETAVGAPNGEGACCDIATYGTKPSAYWTGSSAQCCAGEAKPKLDGSGYECCPVADSCPDGSTPVTNYKDNVGACGKVCCEVKADIYNDLSDGDGPAFSKQLDYEVAGAVNGSCCGGYTKGEYERKWYIIDWGKSDPASGKFVYDGEELVESGSSSSKALILDN